ncbi:hypothetical protein RND81_14G208500 [Saponaria officinalis]|uniref:Uncharacterized protein n=1 Tax=Saponaria officinalis TaxID=3572 RepID=A0AAW1GW53_SAPOF
MAVMVEELKPSQKKDLRSTKNNKNNQQKLSRTSVLEAISKGGKITSYTAEDGTIKMKILVKKQDLKQILGAMNNNNVGFRDRPTVAAPPPSSSTIERRLLELKRKKKANAQVKGSNYNLSSWRPQLQSIPEEH